MSDQNFVEIYDQLMEHLYEIMDDTLHSVADALDIAKEKTSKLGGLTQEEVNHVADFLMRDIEQAASQANAPLEKNSLSEWFKFDIALLENFALEAFTGIADKTRLELAKIEHQAKEHTYHSDDITSPGTFHCEQCDKHIAFKSTSKIPQCPRCQATTFLRD